MKAISCKTASEIAEFILEETILHHGCPNSILTDNGKEFKNELLQTLCDKMSITKKFSSPTEHRQMV